MVTKICIKCKVKQGEENYYWASHKNRLTTKRINTCKACFNKDGKERTKLQYAAKEKAYEKMLLSEPNKTKVCRVCERALKISKFIFHSTMADLLSGECMECRKALAKEKRAKRNKVLDGIDRSIIKTCSQCGERKTLLQFNFHLTSKDWHRNECAECQKINTRKRYEKNGEKYRQQRRQWHKDNPKKTHEWHLKHKFGITREEYKEMLKNQNNQCAICGSKTPGGNYKNFAVDHNHDTGTIRGLLCNPCNTGIGHLQDDSHIIQNALNYLKFYNPVSSA